MSCGENMTRYSREDIANFMTKFKYHSNLFATHFTTSI